MQRSCSLTVVGKASLELLVSTTTAQLLMLLKGFLEPLFIDGEAMLTTELDRQLQWIAVGIVEPECSTSADYPVLSLKEVGQHLLKLSLSLCQSIAELRLFSGELFEDELLVVDELRVGLAIQIDDDRS